MNMSVSEPVNISSGGNVNNLCNCNLICSRYSDVIPCNVSNNNSFGFYQNCRGLRTKLVTVKRNVVMIDYIFIALIETGLNNIILSNNLGIVN